MTPVAALRALASKHPFVEEGVACEGTALESTTFKVRGKAFLFVGPGTARFKLERSLPEVAKLAAKEPSRFKVGAHGWVAINLSQGEVPLFESLEKWIDESYEVLTKKPVKRARPIPVDTPFDEYEHMKALRCECGGAFTWGERDCERLAAPRGRYVLDRFTLECVACRRTRPIEFLCDTGSETYSGLAESSSMLALGLGPEAGAAIVGLFGTAPAPRRSRAKRKPRARKGSPKPRSKGKGKRKRS